jgi:hypothetical protein
MLHSGVFVGRQYAAFAGITHGQKVHDFVERLLARKFVTPIELGSTGRTRIFHVHHKPLYAAIGEPDNRNRRRVTIDRAIERLMILDGVLADRSVTWLGSEREKRCYFKQRIDDHLRDDEYPRLVFGKTPNVTVRYFPDKLPIGYNRDHRRHVFMYLARSPSPMDFRVFILRHLELLNALARSEWKGHVTMPKGGRIRYVPLTRRLTETLRAARHLRGQRVLCDSEGKPLTQKVMQVMVRRVARRANVRPGLHILRHTFCSPGDAWGASKSHPGTGRTPGPGDDAALHAPEPSGARRGDPIVGDGNGNSPRGRGEIVEAAGTEGPKAHVH